MLPTSPGAGQGNMEQRKAFSFLKSFYEAAKLLQSKEEQADFLLAVCQYGLTGEEPEVSGVTAAMFQLVKPNLDSAMAKAAAGAKGGRSKGEANNKQMKANESKSKANDKQNESKKEANESNPEAIKDKGYKDKGYNNNPPIVPPKGEKSKTDFDLFWEAYPNKKGKGAARKAYDNAIKKGVTSDVLIDAVNRQRCGAQWTKDNGQYIPHPATWLNREQWEDEPDFTPVDNSPQKPAYNPHARNDGRAGYQGAMEILKGLIDDEETGNGTEDTDNYEVIDAV